MLEPRQRWFDVSTMVWWGSAILLAVVCCGLAGAATGRADTAPPPGGSEAPVAERAPQPSPAAKADDKQRDSKAVRKELTADERVGPRGVKKRTAVKAGPEPNAAPTGSGPKWACDAQTVTMEPQWLGTPIKATWVVRNEGTSDMSIKVRGG